MEVTRSHVVPFARHEVWDRLMLRLPVFGKLTQKTALTRFSSTLSVLLRSGVPILEALEITSETVNNTDLPGLRNWREAPHTPLRTSAPTTCICGLGIWSEVRRMKRPFKPRWTSIIKR